LKESHARARIRLEHGAPVEELLARLFAEGLDYRDVALALGVHVATVVRWSRDAGYERRIILVK
jgi:DNA invertase Pin-like site-specific DNA recombinase